MVDSAAVAKQPNSFVAELEASNLHPLWDRYQRITPIKPQARDAPFLWRWREIEPFLHRSVGEVSINDIERRALIMAHPAFGAVARLQHGEGGEQGAGGGRFRAEGRMRHPRRRRGDDRQWPALRDEGR